VALEQALALAPELVEGWRELSLLHAARDDAAACDAAKNRQQNVTATCRSLVRVQGCPLGKATPENSSRRDSYNCRT
jgi:hypothetical protein